MDRNGDGEGRGKTQSRRTPPWQQHQQAQAVHQVFLTEYKGKGGDGARRNGTAHADALAGLGGKRQRPGTNGNSRKDIPEHESVAEERRAEQQHRRRRTRGTDAKQQRQTVSRQQQGGGREEGECADGKVAEHPAHDRRDPRERRRILHVKPPLVSEAGGAFHGEQSEIRVKARKRVVYRKPREAVPFPDVQHLQVFRTAIGGPEPEKRNPRGDGKQPGNAEREPRPATGRGGGRTRGNHAGSIR